MFMFNVTLRTFQKDYNAHLLPTSNVQYAVGNRVEFDGVFRKKINFHPVYITQYVELPDGLSDEIDGLFDEIHNSPPIPASMMSIDITREQDFEAALTIPALNLDLGGKVDLNRVRKFSYDNVSSRVICRAAATLLKSGLEEIYPNRNARSERFAFELFYAAKVTLHTENDYAAELKAEFDKAIIEFDGSVKLSGKNNEILTFENGGLSPFASRIESIGDML